MTSLNLQEKVDIEDEIQAQSFEDEKVFQLSNRLDFELSQEKA